MESVTTSTDTQPPAGGRIETTSIHLPGGWRGRITASCLDLPVEYRLPNACQWQTLLQQFVTDPLSLPDSSTLKYVPGAEVLRGTIALGGETLTVIAKHHTATGVGGHLSVILGGSRARRNFERAAALACSGIATALPLAMIERARPTRESWLFTAYTRGVIDLDRIALTVLPQVGASELSHAKNRISCAVVRLFVHLAQSGWHHRDLKASNILLHHHDNSSEPVRAWIVDLDGLSRGPATNTKRERQRLVRLTASLMGYVSVTRTDLARFLRTYLAASGQVRDWRLEFRQVALDAMRYADRSRRRKEHKLEGYTGD